MDKAEELRLRMMCLGTGGGVYQRSLQAEKRRLDRAPVPKRCQYEHPSGKVCSREVPILVTDPRYPHLGATICLKCRDTLDGKPKKTNKTATGSSSTDGTILVLLPQIITPEIMTVLGDLGIPSKRLLAVKFTEHDPIPDCDRFGGKKRLRGHYKQYRLFGPLSNEDLEDLVELGRLISHYARTNRAATATDLVRTTTIANKVCVRAQYGTWTLTGRVSDKLPAKPVPGELVMEDLLIFGCAITALARDYLQGIRHPSYERAAIPLEDMPRSQDDVQVQWEVLAPGDALFERRSLGGRSEILTIEDPERLERLEFLEQLGPIARYRGIPLKGNREYRVAVFSNCVVAECPQFGNALYVYPTSESSNETAWQRVFQSTKKEALELGATRIVHQGDWQTRLRALVALEPRQSGDCSR